MLSLLVAGLLGLTQGEGLEPPRSEVARLRVDTERNESGFCSAFIMFDRMVTAAHCFLDFGDRTGAVVEFNLREGQETAPEDIYEVNLASLAHGLDPDYEDWAVFTVRPNHVTQRLPHEAQGRAGPAFQMSRFSGVEDARAARFQVEGYPFGRPTIERGEGEFVRFRTTNEDAPPRRQLSLQEMPLSVAVRADPGMSGGPVYRVTETGRHVVGVNFAAETAPVACDAAGECTPCAEPQDCPQSWATLFTNRAFLQALQAHRTDVQPARTSTPHDELKRDEPDDNRAPTRALLHTRPDEAPISDLVLFAGADVYLARNDGEGRFADAQILAEDFGGRNPRGWNTLWDWSAPTQILLIPFLGRDDDQIVAIRNGEVHAALADWRGDPPRPRSAVYAYPPEGLTPQNISRASCGRASNCYIRPDALIEASRPPRGFDGRQHVLSFEYGIVRTSQAQTLNAVGAGPGSRAYTFPYPLSGEALRQALRWRDPRDDSLSLDDTIPVDQLADLDGDGGTDLIAFTSTGVRTSLQEAVRITAEGVYPRYRIGFRDWEAASPAFGLGAAARQSMAQSPRLVGDINADGAPDIVQLSPDGILTALGLGDGRFAPARLTSIAMTPEDGWADSDRHFLQDLDGDGRMDIVVIDAGGVRFALADRHNDGEFWPPYQALSAEQIGRAYGGDRESLLIGDVTGDGFADVVYFDPASVTVWPSAHH